MGLNKNHERYYDPTPGKAIRRVTRDRKKKRNCLSLTYRIAEVIDLQGIYHRT